jgi:hypothetical protein
VYSDDPFQFASAFSKRQQALPEVNIQVNRPLPVGGGGPDLASRVLSFIQNQKQQQDIAAQGQETVV